MNNVVKIDTLLNQNKFFIIIQIIVALFLIKNQNLIILYIYILMIEYAIVDYYNKLPTKYSLYLLAKFSFLFGVYFYNNTNLILLLIGLYQILLIFFTRINSKIYKIKINKIISLIILISITIFVLSISWKNLNILHIFLIYPFLYLTFIHLHSLKINKIFCKKNEYNNYNYVLYMLSKIPLSFLVLSSIIIISFLSVTNYSLVAILIATILLIFSIFYEINEYKSYSNISLYKYYSIPISFVILAMVLHWLININIDNSIYKDYVLSVYSTITNIAILNIASLLVIMQLNYQKYGSSYLLIKIVKSKILILITLFPSILIIFNFYVLSEKVPSYSYLPTLFLILSLISTIFLFLYTNIFLETNIIIRQLFNTITNDDFKNYKNNIISIKESNIDSILKITTKVLENNDSTTSRSLFFNLMCWTKLNIHNIDTGNTYYYEKSNNKFNDFFKILVNSIVTSNNAVIHKNFIDSINNMIIRSITTNNYKLYGVIYEFLFEYLILMLYKKEEKISKDIYDTIFRNTSKILLNINFHEIKKYDLVEHTSDLFDFKELFIKPLDKVVEVSIEKKNIEFLKYMDIYRKLFELGYENNKQIDSRAKWDGKIFDIFTETRFLKESINKFLIKENTYWFHIMSDYKIFMPYLHMWQKNTSYQYDDKIKNYIIDRLSSLYKYAIEEKKITSEHDFEIIWEQLYGAIKYNDKDNFQVYTSLFTHFIDLICIKDIKNVSLIKSVWDRLIFIYENEELSKSDLKEFMKQKIDALKNKYPELEKIHKIEYNYQRISEMDILSSFDITKPRSEQAYTAAKPSLNVIK